MLIRRYYDVAVTRSGMRNDVACNRRWGAHFKFDADIRELFPYINRETVHARYSVRPLSIQFDRNGIRCTLFPHDALAAAFESRDHAFEFIEGLVVFLNDLHERRAQIEPDHRVHQPPASVLDIVKVLPRTNCRKCGYPTCMAFAAALRQGITLPDQCPGFAAPIAVRSVYPVLGRDGTVQSTIAIEIDGLTGTRHSNTPGEPPSPPQAQKPDGPLRDNYGIRIQKNLTHRETQVLRLVAEGASNPEISEQMGISHHTVKSHIIHIFNKISVNDRTQAAVWAVRNSVV